MPDPTVHVQGPDGKHYAFGPSSGVTDEASARAWFQKRGISSQPTAQGYDPEQESREVAAGYKKQIEDNTPGAGQRFLEGVGLPGTRSEFERAAQAENDRSLLSRVGEAANPFSLPLKLARTVGDYGKQVYGAGKDVYSQSADISRRLNEGEFGLGEGLSRAGTVIRRGVTQSIPFVGPAMNTAESDLQSENVSGALGGAGAVALQLALLKAGDAKTSADAFRLTKNQVLQASHDILNSAMERTQASAWDAHNNISSRVGQLDAGRYAGDYRDMATKGNKPQIPMADMLDTVRDVADQYGAGGKSTPKFNAAIDAIRDQGGYITLKQAQELKTNLRDLWNKAADGSRDEGAVGKLSDALEEKIRARDTDLGQADQLNARNTLWRTLKTYEDKGILGKLQNAKAGKDYFNILKDPANGAELARVTDDLSKFGFDKDTFTDLVNDHNKLHEYVVDSGKTGFRGVLSSISRHPGAALAGSIVGGPVGTMIGKPIIGSMLGASKAVDMLEKSQALKSIKKLGGVPSTEGRFGRAATVEPGLIGDNEAPPTPAKPPEPTVSVDEVTSALRNQGIKAAEAKSMAADAVADNPNDLTAALKQALSGKKAKPTAESESRDIRAAQAASARGGSTKYIEPSPKGFGTAKVPIEETAEGQALAEKVKQARKKK